MAKRCEFCGKDNYNSAVTCGECGSLFEDMVGTSSDEPEYLADAEELGPEILEDADADDGARLANAASAAPGSSSPVPAAVVDGPEFSQCGDCRVVFQSGPKRCVRCGSRHIVVVPRTALAGARSAKSGGTRGRRLSAWDRRPKQSPVDAEYGAASMGQILPFVVLGAAAMIVEIPLGAWITTATVGPNGLDEAAFNWHLILGPATLAAAAAGGVGAYLLYFLNRAGAVLLSLSFALDALLFAWIVVALVRDLTFIWPGPGPYLFASLVCLVLAVLVGMLAREGALS